MGPIERVGGGDGVEIGGLREALAESRGTAARRPLRAEIGRAERRRESGRDADDGIGQVDAGGVLELDRSIGQQRGLRGRRPGRLEAADVAPRDGVLVARGVDEDAAAGARVEVGEKQGDARRAGQQAADAAVRARAVALAKRDVAVGVDERRPLVGREERKGEGHVGAQAVVVCESDPVADGGPERGVGLPDVVAALGVAGETEAQALQIEGVRRNDEVSLVAEHGDVADVGRSRGNGPEGRDGAAALGRLLMDPEGFEDAPARRRVERRGPWPRGRNWRLEPPLRTLPDVARRRDPAREGKVTEMTRRHLRHTP